jgi:hypothetical protein
MRLYVNQQDQQAIDDLFQHLYRTSAQAGPPDSEAEARIQQHIRQGPPGLLYQMAQTLVGQQAALRQLRSQLADCEQQLRQGGFAAQQAYGGYGQQYQQRAGWGSGGQGFLAGAGQIALGVGGGILAAEALSNLFGGGGLFGDDQGYDDRADYDDRGDYDDRQDDGAQDDSGQYDSGQYDSGQYDSGQYDSDGGYDDTGFDGGGFDDGGGF